MSKVSIESIYKVYTNILTPQECQDIIDLFPTLETMPASVYGDSDLKDSTFKVEPKNRSGVIAFTKFTDLPHWGKMLRTINHFNETQLLNLNGEYEVQLAKYEVGDHFTKHQDTSAKQFSRMHDGERTRKISASVQLSSEKDYTGGDFVFFTEKSKEGSKAELVDKKPGTMVIFPSYCEHMVSKIESGTRYSLVLWALGPYWR